MINFDNMTLAGMIVAIYLVLGFLCENIYKGLMMFIIYMKIQNPRWLYVRDAFKRMSYLAYSILAWWTIGGVIYAYIVGISVWKHWGFY